MSNGDPQNASAKGGQLGEKLHEIDQLANLIVSGIERLALISPTTAQKACLAELQTGADGLLAKVRAAIGLSGQVSGSGLLVVRPRIITELREESPGLLEHLIHLFFKTAQQTVDDLDGLVAAESRAEISARSHHLKGSASNFGAERLMATCQQLEKRAAAASQSELETLLKDLHREYELVVETLKGYLPHA